MGFAENIASIRTRIDAAVKRRGSSIAGRYGAGVTIVAASKYVGSEAIIEAARAGVRIFGENRVQDLKDKVLQIEKAAPDILGAIEFHTIGHLQTNKARDAVAYSSLIQSVDSLRLAEKINECAAKLSKKTGVLIEVKTSSEDTKTGIAPDEALLLAEGIEGMPHLELAGVMTMAEFTNERVRIIRCFDLARQVYDALGNRFGEKCRYLSMGMSEDFEVAIESGANMVRLGRVLFK